MNENSIENSAIAIEYSHVDNDQHDNSRQNTSNSARIANFDHRKKMSSMASTPLEYSWLSKHRSFTPIGACTMFTIVTMTTGILIVYFSSLKVSETCELKFKSTSKNPIEYNYGPQSVAVGDFNKDTWLDIVIVNHLVNNISVYFGYDNGTFSSPIEYHTGIGSAPYMVAVADFNNDNQLDIAVVNFGTNNIGLLFGLGNGSFTACRELSTGSSRPIFIIVADFNKDKQLDIVTANYGTHSISLFYAYANGNFLKPLTYLTGYDSFPFSLAVGDFNSDNHLDIAVANYGTDNVGVFFGSANGTFTNQITFSIGFGSHPYAISAADFNHDTFDDIAVANRGTNEIGVLLSNGNGTFEKQIIYFINSASPYSIAIVDFNQDKQLDIIVTNNGQNNIAILFGYGNGTFTNPVMYSTGTVSSISFAVDDFNKDTWLDIVVVSNDTGSIDTLLGYYERFANQMTFATGSFPSSVAIDDLNNDTHLDIIVANAGDNTTSLLFGYGNGSFGNHMTFLTGSNPYSVAIGDFNNDTRLDIVVANMDSNDVSVLLGYGNGSFANQMTYSTGNGSSCVVIADFNDDTRLDIVVTNVRSNDVSVLLGYGNGSFANQTIYSTGSYPFCVAVSDLNNDTRLDIVVANYGSNDVSVLLGHGNGSFENQITYSAGSGSGSLAVADFNHDRRLDIVAANYYSNNISVFLQHNRVILINQTTFASDGGSRLRYVAVGDVNNDTHLDIVVANYGTNNVGVLIRYGNGTFQKQMMLNTGSTSHPTFVAIGHYNSDHQLDIAAGNSGSKNVDILMGNGKGEFTIQINHGNTSLYTPSVAVSGDFNHDQQSEIVVAYDGSDHIDILVAYNVGSFRNQMKYSTNSGPYSIAVGDLNNDTRLDIVTANSGSDDASVLLGLGNGSFVNQMNYSTGSYPTSVAVADFNNDTRLDIVIANSGSNDISVLLGHGNGSFTNQTRYSAGSYPFCIAVGDVNNDARVDIIIANSYSNDVSVLLGHGNGSFMNQMKYATGSSPSAVVVADFNHDTQSDVVTANWDSNDASILLGYGNGSFTNSMTYSTGSNSNPSSVAVSDFNHDIQLDLIVVNYASNDVRVFLGFGNGIFGSPTTYSVGSSPSSVAVEDFNNDSQMDIVTTNYGSNDVSLLLGYVNIIFRNQMTLITGNGSGPRLFAIGDFNNDDRMDIAVANLDAHNIGIFLGYGNISFTDQAMYSTGSSSYPVSIAVGDFNNDRRLDMVVANYGSDNVGIFLGYGNGSFTSQIIYSTGSSSEPYSVAVDDFNNDTLLDIVIANYGTNNLDVFLGYGDGTFSSLHLFSLDYGSHPFFIVVGDFNNDRKLDFAVANDGTDNLHILLQTC